VASSHAVEQEQRGRRRVLGPEGLAVQSVKAWVGHDLINQANPLRFGNLPDLSDALPADPLALQLHGGLAHAELMRPPCFRTRLVFDYLRMTKNPVTPARGL